MSMKSPGEEPPNSTLLPADEEWEDLEDQELETFVQEHEKKLDEVRSFLSIAEKQYKYVFFGDGKESVKIKVRAAVPYEIRRRQGRLQEELIEMYKAARENALAQGQDPDKIRVNDLKVMRPMYEILAGVCMEEPWNDWRTWAVIDKGVRGKIKGSGYALVMMDRIFNTIAKSAEDVKSFRPDK